MITYPYTHHSANYSPYSKPVSDAFTVATPNTASTIFEMRGSAILPAGAITCVAELETNGNYRYVYYHPYDECYYYSVRQVAMRTSISIDTLHRRYRTKGGFLDKNKKRWYKLNIREMGANELKALDINFTQELQEKKQ